MGWLELYVDYAKNNEAPEKFHWWTGVAILGAAMRRNIVFKRGRFRVFPNPWVLVVAPSGAKKSTALDIGYNILSKIEHVKMLPNRFTPEVLLRSLAKKGEGEANVESQAILLTTEFGVVLDRKHYNEGLTQLLLDLWDCRDDWNAETVTGGVVHLRNIAITLLACVADDIFKESMPELALKSGFLARMLVVTGKDEGRIEAFPWTDDGKEEEIINDLYALSLIKGDMKFGKKAEDWYIAWYIKHKSKLRGTVSDRMRAYYERKPKHMLQVGMLCSLSATGMAEFSVAGFEEAEERLEDLESGMESLFEAIQASPLGKSQMRIIDQIKKSGGRISHRDLLKQNYNFMSDPTLFKKIMTHLLETGMVGVMKNKRGEILYEIKEVV